MWKKNSLNVKILGFFLLFSILLLVFLWTFQVLFIDSFYRNEKTKDVESVGNYIKTIHNKKNAQNLLDEISFEKEVCIEITDRENFLYSSNFFGKGCMMDGNQKISLIQDFIESNLEETFFEFNNPRFNNETLLYAIQLSDNKYAFVNTSIEPIDATVYILEKQLMIVTVIILVLSFIISFFISHHLSKPIITLNNQAKKMANGDFKSKFDDQSNILELNELSNTLNYARDELSKTDELRRDLIANVSHDLKTPLTMIKAYAEMSMDLHKKKPKKQKEDMEIIISETDRLSALVQDILDLSKMEANTEELQIEEFDLITLTEEIVKKYHLYQELENYQFILNHEKDSIIISADKKRIEQVIYNLINNAINYTGEDNIIEIYIAEIKNKVRVEIKDTGQGITKEEIPYIWDRYYKNKKKHKRNVVGTGLGLSIVKKILEQHQYVYGVDSKENQGTTFYFEIPKKKEK